MERGKRIWNVKDCPTMLYRSYLVGGLLVLALFGLGQYRGWSIFGASEAKSPPGATRSIDHK